VALGRVDGLTFSYPGAKAPAVADVSFTLEPGDVVALLGPSGSGKSTVLRALAGLVPHFHGGRFAGRVEICGADTRRTRPAELAGRVATVFQDPEDQVVMARAANEVAFGPENLGVAPGQIWPRVDAALAAVDATHLRDRLTTELSGGELQRICLAAALALEPELLLLDEPTSQLDPAAAERFLTVVERLGATVVLCEQRVERALEIATRVLYVEGGRLLLDAPAAEAEEWLRGNRPRYAPGGEPEALPQRPVGEPVVRLTDVSFAYRPGVPVLDGVDLTISRGEIVALEGENGSGKTTLAKVAAGLLEAQAGGIEQRGRAGYLLQDPGRYLVAETALAEAALAVGGDEAPARAALAAVDLTRLADRHPRDLSSGERERLGVAAVAVAEPDLLVLDEPTRGLDPDRKTALSDWLVEYAAAGRGVIVATHDRRLPAHRRIRLGGEVLVAA